MALHRKFLAALALSAAAMAGPAAALPHWSSDQIRAARPLAAEEAVVFDMRTEVRRGDQPPTVTLSTVTLAPSFSQTTSGEDHRLDDHALCRELHWNDGAKLVGDVSCYALPAFRVIELRNRQFLGRMLAKAKLGDAQATGPYWDEAALGVQAGAGAPLTARTNGEATEYRLGRLTPVKVEGITGQLSPGEMERFVRYLSRNVSLHPQVRRDIAKRGDLPGKIESQNATLGVVRGTTIVTFSNLRRTPTAFPLPASLSSETRVAAAKGDTARDAGLRVALAAIDEKPASAKPTLRALRDGFTSAKDPLQAYLYFVNMTQQYGAEITKGPDSRAIIAEISPGLRLALLDPRVAQFDAASRLAGGDPRAKGDPQAAARFLAEDGEMDVMHFGTFRRVTYANLAQSTQGAQKWDPAITAAMPRDLADNYWIHIAAYPWSSNAFKDVGQAYFQSFDTPSAWLAYDLGRAVDPDWRTTSMAEVEALETRLRTEEPDFF